MSLIQEKLNINNPATQDIPLISDEMKDIENELMNIVTNSDAFIRNKLVNLFYSGKRLRPKLVLLSGLCFSPINDDMIYTAIASELIHTASLVHDDIIDRANYRRSKPTINYTSGNHAAVLAGDFLFAKAFEILSKKGLIMGMEYLVVAIQEMCIGEMFQAQELFNTRISAVNYMEKNRRKTGALLSACCMAGAQSGGADGVTIEKFGIFGRFLGLAFQIIDDLLDFIGDKKQVGKTVAHDLEEGNITLPIIYLLEDPKYQIKYEKAFRDKDSVHKIKDELLIDLKESGVLKRTHYKAELFAEEARKVIEPMPNSAYKDILMLLTKKIVNRIY